MSEQNDKACAASNEDLRRGALEHYERVSSLAHEWHSAIPRAINFYYDQRALQNSATQADRPIEMVCQFDNETRVVRAEMPAAPGAVEEPLLYWPEHNGGKPMVQKSDYDAIAVRLRAAEQRAEREKAYFKKLDSIIDEEGVARSCINPFEDLRRAIRGLKSDLAAERERAERMKDWLRNNMTFYETGESTRPVLQDVAKRIWYHATDNQDACPFDSVIDQGRGNREIKY